MSELLLPDSAIPKVPKIKDVKPFGSKILVESLTLKELLETSVILTDKTSNVQTPEVYIIALGPNLETMDNCPVSVGQRVLVTGQILSFADDKHYGNHGKRKRGLIELHQIQAVLIEEEVLV